MQSYNSTERDDTLSGEQQYKCKVRDNQEVGRWKKSEHDAFLKGKAFY